MKDFKYKTSFSSVIRCVVDEEKSKCLAIAALHDLKGIIPESIRGEPDLLAICGNAFTPNLANKNGDVIDTATALKVYKSFIHRPININHSRKDVVGHVVSAGFSKFDVNYATGGGSEVLQESEITDSKEPFNVALSAVIYRVVNEELVGLIEDSNDPTSNKYLNYSYSWELGYNNFSLAIGSRDLRDCEIITDEAKIKDLEKYLLANGGKGVTEDNKPIYRLIHGEVYPLGIAVTESPAGLLRGIVTDTAQIQNIKVIEKSKSSETITCPECGHKIEMEDDEEDNMDDNTEDSEDSEAKKSCKNENKISQSNINSVTNSSKENIIIKKHMDKISKITDLNDENLKECKASAVIELFNESLKEADKKWKEQEELTKNAQAEKLKVEANLTKIQEDLKKLQDIQAAKEAEEIYTQRMTYFDDTYELSKEERQAIAAEIKDADKDSFEKAKSKFDIFLKDKSKAAIKEKQDLEEAEAKKSGKVFDKEKKKWVNKDEMKEEKKESKASLDENGKVIDEALANGKNANAALPNAQSGEQTLEAKYAEAFKPENCIEISKR